MGEQTQRSGAQSRGSSHMHCNSPPDLPRRISDARHHAPRRHGKTSGDQQHSEALSSPPEQQLPCALLSFLGTEISSLPLMELQRLACDTRLCWTLQAIGPEQMVAEVPKTLLRDGVDDRGRCVRAVRILSGLLMFLPRRLFLGHNQQYGNLCFVTQQAAPSVR